MHCVVTQAANREMDRLETNEKRTEAAEQTLAADFVAAIAAGLDPYIPTYSVYGKTRFYRISSHLSDSTREAQAMLYEACSKAFADKTESGIATWLRGYVEALAAEYGELNAEGYLAAEVA